MSTRDSQNAAIANLHRENADRRRRLPPSVRREIEESRAAWRERDRRTAAGRGAERTDYEAGE